MKVHDLADAVDIWRVLGSDPGRKEVCLSKRSVYVSGLHSEAVRRLPESLDLPPTVLDAALLAGALALFDQDADLGLRLDESSLTLTAGKRRVTLTQRVAELPSRQRLKPSAPVSESDSASLRRALSFLGPCVADGVTRPQLTGLLFRPRNGRLAVTATDGERRSGEGTVETNAVLMDGDERIVPAADLATALGLVNVECIVELSDGHALIADDRTAIRLSLLQGAFPATDQLPKRKTFKHSFDFALEPFDVALRAAQLLDADRLLSLVVKGGKAAWVVSGDQVGGFRVPAGKAEGGDVSIMFDGLALEPVRNIDDEIALYYNDERSPVLFYGKQTKFLLWMSPIVRG